MRLEQTTLHAMTDIFSRYLKDKSAELRLFGSRTNDALRGGDIDLLLICENAATANQLKDIKHYLLADLKTAIGDQKIDLLITDNSQLNTDPFLEIIYPGSMAIHQF